MVGIINILGGGGCVRAGMGVPSFCLYKISLNSKLFTFIVSPHKIKLLSQFKNPSPMLPQLGNSEETLTLHNCPFSVQVDETNMVDNNVLMMAYVHYVCRRGLAENFLLRNTLPETGEGETMDSDLTKFLQEREILV